MFLVTVTPITKEPIKDNLSYFTTRDVKLGSIVLAPIRTRMVRALVTACQSVLENKSALKNSPFPIKKIESVAEGTVFSPAFIEGVTKAAEYYATFPGNLLRAYIPEEILEKWGGVPGEYSAATSGLYEPMLLQAPFIERIGSYRAMIREEFAKRKSIMIVVPSRPLVEELRESLAKGIDDYMIVLHGDLSKKEMLSAWERATSTEHPVLIIATPSFLALPRKDLGTLVLEYESSSGYKNMFRPLVDSRHVARLIAEAGKFRIVFADTLLSVETMAEREMNSWSTLAPIKHRLVSAGETALVDMKNRKDPKADPFFSDELLTTIRTALSRKGNVFLFTVRKGVAPLTVCSDCGTTLACPTCNRPLVLFSEAAGTRTAGIKNIFICNGCEKEYPTDTRCTVCNSWRLMPLGIGTEKVAEQIGTYFPGTPVFLLDGDHVKTHKQGLTMSAEFQATKGAVLIGTEMALQYARSVTASGIVAIDNIFAIPDFHMNEKLMHILTTVREKTEGAMVIQTRKSDVKVFHHAARGTLLDFFRDEMVTRKKYRYPPYLVFIKISREGKSDEVHADMDVVEELFKEYSPEIFSGFYAAAPGEEVMHALIRIEPDKWPDPKLSQRLRSLPYKFVIDVNPEELL